MIKDDKCEIAQMKESNQIKEITDSAVAEQNYNFLS